jgi:hypothetical protein
MTMKEKIDAAYQLVDHVSSPKYDAYSLRTALVHATITGRNTRAYLESYKAMQVLEKAMEDVSSAKGRLYHALYMTEIGCTRWGCREAEDMDGYTYRWWVFPRSLLQGDTTPQDLAEQVAASEWYGGPGRAFTHRPHVRVHGSRVLVSQVSGYDI